MLWRVPVREEAAPVMVEITWGTTELEMKMLRRVRSLVSERGAKEAKTWDLVSLKRVGMVDSEV